MPAPPPPPVPILPARVTPQEYDSTSISSLCLESVDSPLMSPSFAKMSAAMDAPEHSLVRLTAGKPRSGIETAIFWESTVEVGGPNFRRFSSDGGTSRPKALAVARSTRDLLNVLHEVAQSGAAFKSLHDHVPRTERHILEGTSYYNTGDVLSDTSRRIGAMGAAQQVFYAVHNSTDVSGQGLLEAVCANAKAFFSEEVSINCEAATGYLPKETAVPLALVLNELLTNAAKHGANDHGRVRISVGLSQRPGEIELYVQDHGSGFNFEEDQWQSSGLGLVTTLAKRLKGTFMVERRSGARCTLRFPDQ